jgi:hypothetical protein
MKWNAEPERPHLREAERFVPDQAADGVLRVISQERRKVLEGNDKGVHRRNPL